MPNIPPATVLILLGILTGLLSLPLLFNLVPPNRFYGIRVCAAFASESNWYAINSFGAKRLLLFSAVITTTGLLLQAIPQAPFWLPIAGLFFTLFLLLATVRSISRYTESLTKQK